MLRVICNPAFVDPDHCIWDFVHHNWGDQCSTLLSPDNDECKLNVEQPVYQDRCAPLGANFDPDLCGDIDGNRRVDDCPVNNITDDQCLGRYPGGPNDPDFCIHDLEFGIVQGDECRADLSEADICALAQHNYNDDECWTSEPGADPDECLPSAPYENDECSQLWGDTDHCDPEQGGDECNPNVANDSDECATYALGSHEYEADDDCRPSNNPNDSDECGYPYFDSSTGDECQIDPNDPDIPDGC